MITSQFGTFIKNYCLTCTMIRTGKESSVDTVVLELELLELHCRFFPQLLLLFLLPPFALCSSSVEESVPTYEHQDPSTGTTLLCTKCPPGEHMVAHCTPSMPTKCVPCGENHFTELWNYLPRCLYCSNFCYENQEVEKECSATSNRVCRCKGGFYWSSGFCFRHSECKPGMGVETEGIPVCVEINWHLNMIMLQTHIPDCYYYYYFIVIFYAHFKIKFLKK